VLACRHVEEAFLHPLRPDLTQKARDLRLHATAPERRLWRDVLSRKQLDGFKFLRQKPLGSYIVDFYCAELRLAVEIDGETHADQAVYDEARTAALKEMGEVVVR